MADSQASGDFLDAGMLARLSRLTVSVRLPMLGSVTGLHRSATRGSSVEFAEYRKYAPGDDPRYLDWRVFARTDRFFMKEFEADTNLRCYLVVDTSASMRFASGESSRFEYAQRLAGTLAHLLMNQGDAVGLVCSDGEGLQELPPRRTPSHLRQLLEMLGRARPRGETTLVAALHELAERIRQRSLVVVLSDLLADAPEILRALKHLRFYKHDVAIFHLLDRQEFEFDFRRPVRFVDLETGAEVITDPALVREGYRSALEAHLAVLRHGCREYDVDYRLNYLHQGSETLLSQFLLERLRRGKRNRR